jgi:hypothetical protein
MACASLQLTETALQHLFLEPGQRADHVIGKLASENRAQLCHFTQPRRSIEPRHQRILQCLRDVQLREGAPENVGVATGLDHPEARMALVSSSRDTLISRTVIPDTPRKVPKLPAASWVFRCRQFAAQALRSEWIVI